MNKIYSQLNEKTWFIDYVFRKMTDFIMERPLLAWYSGIIFLNAENRSLAIARSTEMNHSNNDQIYEIGVKYTERVLLLHATILMILNSIITIQFLRSENLLGIIIFFIVSTIISFKEALSILYKGITDFLKELNRKVHSDENLKKEKDRVINSKKPILILASKENFSFYLRDILTIEYFLWKANANNCISFRKANESYIAKQILQKWDINKSSKLADLLSRSQNNIHEFLDYDLTNRNKKSNTNRLENISNYFISIEALKAKQIFEEFYFK